MIDPKFWSDDRMMVLTPRHRLLFIGIWNFSDDSGIHKNNNTVLKAEIFPCDDISINEVGELKQGLIDAGLIIEFEDKDNNSSLNLGIGGCDTKSTKSDGRSDKLSSS